MSALIRKYTTKEIQKTIFTIIQYIDTFCRENEIQYYLMGGSALGAMRHNGFIPWDDDLDIFMTCDNYERFMRIFEEKGDKERFFLERENTEEWPLFISQLCLNGTTMINDEFKLNMKKHHAVFVDIMCLYSAPENKVARWFQYMAAQLVRINALERSSFSSKSKIKNIALKMSRIIVNSITRPILIKYIHRYEGKDTKYMGHYFGRARFNRCAFPRSYLGTPRYVSFETMELPVFENVEAYLNSRFGDSWMEMPDQKTRDQYPNHGGFVDLEKNYTEYLSADKKSWNILNYIEIEDNK